MMLASTDICRYRSEMIADPLSDVIALSGAKCTVTRCMESDGDWNYRFSPPGIIKFIAIRRGHCWLSRGGAEPVALRETDVFMLRGKAAFALASNLSKAPKNATGKFSASKLSPREKPTSFQAICGHVTLDTHAGQMLEDALPQVVLIRGETQAAEAMRWLLDQLVSEINGDRPGAALASTELAQLLFVHVIRACMVNEVSIPVSWISALSDRRMARALRLLHASPGAPWRVDKLAAQAGMSRTNFAVRFAALVGVPPMAYLAAWRMRLAEHSLRTSDASIAQIARLAGFATLSGFSAAFLKAHNESPTVYRTRFTTPSAR